jgi:hypothetical protein
VTATIYRLDAHRRRKPFGIVGLFSYRSPSQQRERIAEMVRAGIPLHVVASVSRRTVDAVRSAVQDEQ